MKIAQAFMIGSAALAASLFVLPVHAAEQHLVFSPDKIQWGPAPDVLPKGAEAALLYGDPTKEGQFALRLRLPSGYHVPPHSHPLMRTSPSSPARSNWEWERPPIGARSRRYPLAASFRCHERSE